MTALVDAAGRLLVAWLLVSAACCSLLALLARRAARQPRGEPTGEPR